MQAKVRGKRRLNLQTSGDFVELGWRFVAFALGVRIGRDDQGEVEVGVGWMAEGLDYWGGCGGGGWGAGL